MKNIIIKLNSLFSQFSRLVRTGAAVLAVAAVAITCARADSYYWNGGGDGSSWTDGRNWGKTQDNYPNASDAQVMIRSDAPATSFTIDINSPITIGALAITNCTVALNLNSSTLTIAGTTFGLILGKDPTGGANTGDTQVTINTGTLIAVKVEIEPATNSTLILDNSTFDCSGASSISGTLNQLSVMSDATIKGGSESAGTLNIASLTSTGTTSNLITTSGYISLNESTISSSFENSGTLTLNNALTVSGNFENTGTVDAGTNAITVSGDFINTGTFYNPNASIKMKGASVTFAGGGCTVNSLTYAPPAIGGGSLELNGDNNFKTFSCTAGWVTITVNGTETVSEKLILKGKGASRRLTVTGSGGFQISSSQTEKGRFLTIDKSGPVISAVSGNVYYIATDSSFSDSTYGLYHNWIIVNSDMTFKWNGNISEEWETPENWDCNLVPGIDSSNPAATGGVSTTGYDIEIPDSVADDSFYPIVNNNYKTGSLIIGTSTETAHNAKLLLTGGSVFVDTASSKNLKNMGTIFYLGSGRIKDSTSTFINDADNGGTVDFAVDASDISSVSYHNLTISGGNGIASDSLNIGGKLTVSNSASANFNNATNATATKVKSVDFSTTGAISIGNNKDDIFNVTDSNLLFPSTLGALTLAGKIEVEGTGYTISMSKDASLAANTTFCSPASIDADITISDDSNSGKLLTCEKTLTSSTYTLTCKNISLTNLDSAQDAKITFTEGNAPASQIFTPHESSVYNTVIINKSKGGNFSVDDNKLEVKSLNFTDNTGKISFGKKLTVTVAFADPASNTGNVEFTEGADFTPEAVFNTSGNVEILTDSTFTGGLTHTTGKTIIAGTITTGDKPINLGTTTLAENSYINAGTGTVSFGTLDSETDSFSLDASGTSGAVTFGGAVGHNTPLSSLKISGTCAIRGGEITTTGPQTYNGAVAISDNDASITNSSTNAGDFITFNAGISSADKKLTISSINNGVLYTGTAGSVWSVGNGIKLTGTDLFLDGTNTLTLSCDISCKNLYFYRGKLGTTKKITTSADFAVWGEHYDPTDKGWSASNTRFAYYIPATGLKRYPAGGSSITNTSAAFSNLAGAVIAVGSNFYVNGANIDAGSFTLTLPSAVLSSAILNTTAAVTEGQWGLPYAAAFNLKVSDCTAAGISVAAGSYAYDGTNADTSVTVSHGHNVEDGGGNLGWQFHYPQIIEARTVEDNKVYVKFNLPAEYTPDGVEEVKYNNNGFSFTDITTLTADKKEFCITTTNNRWNTDATGTSTGTSTSTDSTGTHQSVTADLSILEGVFRAAEGKTMNINYGRQTVTESYKNVYDAAGPVLITVTTGRESHTEYDAAAGEASQHSYDGHNYIEFKYSEKVNFGLPGSSDFYPAENYATMENVQVTDSLGGISEFAATSGGTVTVAGLGQITSGLIHTGKDGSDNKYVNTLYRNDEYSVRLSVAGWTDGTFTGSDANEYKKWAGYITKAIVPSGGVSLSGITANPYVTDCAVKLDGVTPLYNQQTLAKTGLVVEKSTIDNDWDTTPPSFAPFRTNRTLWTDPVTSSSSEYEIVGTSDIGGSITHLEFHMFGDKPAYSSTENPQWFSRIGWAAADAENAYTVIDSKAADTRNGGIRYSTLYNAQSAFTYSVYGGDSYSTFTQKIIPGTKSSIFTYSGEETGNTTGGADGHYFRIPLDTTFSVSTRFSIKFNPSDCYLTDLAGNRIQGDTITATSIDRTPPNFDITAAPVGTDKMLIIFSKHLQVEDLELYTLNPDGTTSVTKKSALALIPKSLVLTTESGTGIEIDQTVPAELAFITNETTGVIITLTKNTVLKDITSQVFVKTVASSDYSYDPILGSNGAQITYIQDEKSNYITTGSEHAFSDFAIDAVQPLYAYDNTLNQDGTPVALNLYSEGTYAVHDWDAEQKNYGTINAGNEIIMQTKITDGTSDSSGGASDVARVSAYFDASPDAGAVSTTINSVTEKNWRIWLPAEGSVFKNLAPVNNSQYITEEGTAKSTGFLFDIAKETVSTNWKSGDQISFLFMLGDFKVRHNGSSDTEMPLYALRLKNPSDLTSLDLWSFRLKAGIQQRGGVTILNNVINVDNGENTVIQVNMPESGSLNVIVMTLDGNVVTYLQHGWTDAGMHSYNWNGRNKGGSPVARGLYFVRITGPGIDETRKVMCVK